MIPTRPGAESPFGPGLQRYWDKRHEYFARFDEGVQIDAEGLYSVMPEDAALAAARRLTGQRVLDGFAGVGGCCIALARAGKCVTAVDIDPDRLAMARRNAEIYGVGDAITFICGDFLELARRIDADAVVLDPPWGGPSYRTLDRFRLKHLLPDGNALLDLALAQFPEVALRVPLNFDLDEVSGFELHDDVSYGQLISRTLLFRRP